MSRNFYDVLCVKKDASQAEIKSAFLKLAKEYHPDRSQGNEQKRKEYEQKMKEINEAYSVLNNAEKRSNYDRTGSPDGGFSGFGGGTGADFSDLFSNFGFGGGSFHQFNFEDLFGSSSRRSEQGESISVKIIITIQEAFRGCQRVFELENKEKCNSCKGQRTRCAYCHGSGKVNVFFQCGSCKGSGVMNGRSGCSICKGEGTVFGKKRMEIKIDPGVVNNQKIRFAGMGSSSSAGSNGDLFVQIEVKNDTKFVVDGVNLVLKCSIDAMYLVTGVDLIVKSIDDRDVNVKIPRGFKSDRLVVRGEGFPYFGHAGKRGDLIIHICPYGSDVDNSSLEYLKKTFKLNSQINVN